MKDANKEPTPPSTLSQKEHRRAQVRRAQKSDISCAFFVPSAHVLTMTDRHHRQQKKNYVKFLEEDVIRLREMISVVENETAIFRNENAAMKSTLSRNGVQAAPDQLLAIDSQVPTRITSSADGRTNLHTNYPMPLDESNSPQHRSPWGTLSAATSSSTISIGYDDRIRAKRLRVSPASDEGSQNLHVSTRSPPPATFDAMQDLTLPDPASCFADPPPQFANFGVLETMPRQLDSSFDGINFILA